MDVVSGVGDRLLRVDADAVGKGSAVCDDPGAEGDCSAVDGGGVTTSGSGGEDKVWCPSTSHTPDPVDSCSLSGITVPSLPLDSGPCVVVDDACERSPVDPLPFNSVDLPVAAVSSGCHSLPDSSPTVPLLSQSVIPPAETVVSPLPPSSAIDDDDALTIACPFVTGLDALKPDVAVSSGCHSLPESSSTVPPPSLSGSPLAETVVSPLPPSSRVDHDDAPATTCPGVTGVDVLTWDEGDGACRAVPCTSNCVPLPRGILRPAVAAHRARNLRRCKKSLRWSDQLTVTKTFVKDSPIEFEVVVPELVAHGQATLQHPEIVFIDDDDDDDDDDESEARPEIGRA